MWSLAALAAFAFFAAGPLARPAQAQSVPEISNPTCADNSDPETCEGMELLNSLLNFMAILVMPLIVIMIIIGGIQYSMAAANPEALKAARARIYKAIIALVFFAGLWSLLKWLLPGGLG